ncbi:MAG: flavodoxin family protein [Lachnospiraceae bacterium]|nr:flavodoxin family protein [Lachnospiraceae bacterium]
MSKKILILTGSPRRNGNTLKMAKAFEKGALEAGHEVVWFDAGAKNLKGCRGCNGCWSKGKACCQDDDFNELAELLETCDMLQIVTPLYWFNFPAQIKAAIDKLYAYGGAGGLRPLSIKETGLFVAGELADEWEYQPLLDTYKYVFGYLNQEDPIKDRGVIRVYGLENPENLRDALEKAEAFGREV